MRRILSIRLYVHIFHEYKINATYLITIIPFEVFCYILKFLVDIPKNPDYDHPEKYGLEGVVNFNITTKDLDGTTPVRLGGWLIVPEDEVTSTSVTSHGISTATQLLADTQKPVLLYLHGVACNRVQPIKTYKVLRQFFLIIAVDHRGK